MNTLKIFFVLVSIISSLPFTVHAEVWCDGNVFSVHTTDKGDVLINTSYRNDYTAICNINQVWNGVEPMTCALWFSTVKTAQSQNKLIKTYYFNFNSCDAIPAYGLSPSPGYVMLK